MTTFLETRALPADVVAWLSTWLSQDIPFDDVPEGESAYTIPITFRDGYVMDIEVVNGRDGQPSWVDYNLWSFEKSPNGVWGYYPIDCGPYEDYGTKLLNDFELYYNGNTYIAVLTL